MVVWYWVLGDGTKIQKKTAIIIYIRICTRAYYKYIM